jgi:hypothetical protein
MTGPNQISLTMTSCSTRQGVHDDLLADAARRVLVGSGPSPVLQTGAIGVERILNAIDVGLLGLEIRMQGAAHG